MNQKKKKASDIFSKKSLKSKSEKLKKTHSEQLHGSINKAKTRIKQKSLAAIVAKNLGHSGNAKRVSFLADKQNSISVNVNKESHEKISSQPDVSREKLDSDNIVQFIKNKSGNEPKATVIRKRNDNSSGQKKSLSEIFSNTSGKVDSDSSTFNFGNVTKSESDLQISVSKFKNEGNFKNKKTNIHEREGKRFNSEVRTNKRNERNDRSNKKFKGKDERVVNRNSGKVSSLFGNNPDVPNIGQRFVKPVQENVFSGINFSDLNIHPYSVCIFIYFIN